MKPQERVLDVDTNMRGEKIAMGIDDAALAHIMTVLTDLYSDQEMAVIREYSTNAYDAHIEAGVKDPIHVTLPGPLSPTFVVRDFGNGLDIEDIRDIYSRYGTSTKRGSNDVVGMLGLGCKSALTYTDQFTLTGIKNGIATQVSISRDANGAGSMTIVNQYPTTDRSGVEIVVPTRVGNQFAAKSEKFYRFWKPGTVLVNGKEPKRIDGMWIADDLLLTKEVDRNMIVMGNVAYPDPDPYAGRSYGYHSSVAFVDIGAVHFTPSREALQKTAQTNATIAHLKQRFEKETNAALIKQIETAPTGWEAIEKVRLSKPLGHKVGTATWKGKPVPETITLKNPDKFLTIRASVGYSKYGSSRYDSVNLSQFESPLWVVGYDADTMTPYKKQKVDQWITKNRGSVPYNSHIIFVKEFPKELTGWVNPAQIVDWAVIDAEKIVRDSSAPLRSGRPTGSYSAIVGGQHTDKLLAKDIDTSKPIYWIQGNRYINVGYLNWLRRKHPDATFIFLPANRVNKFERDFPMAVQVLKAVKGMATDWRKNLSRDQVDALLVRQSGNYGFYSKLDLNEIPVEDTWLRNTVRVSKIDTNTLLEEYKFFTSYDVSLGNSWTDQLSVKYPLLGSVYHAGLNSKVLPDVYLYINAVVANNKNGGSNV